MMIPISSSIERPGGSTSEPESYSLRDISKLLANAFASNLDAITLPEVECSACPTDILHVCPNKLRPMVLEALKAVLEEAAKPTTNAIQYLCVPCATGSCYRCTGCTCADDGHDGLYDPEPPENLR